jgi:hypothetical protein
VVHPTGILIPHHSAAISSIAALIGVFFFVALLDSVLHALTHSLPQCLLVWLLHHGTTWTLLGTQTRIRCRDTRTLLGTRSDSATRENDGRRREYEHMFLHLDLLLSHMVGVARSVRSRAWA